MFESRVDVEILERHSSVRPRSRYPNAKATLSGGCLIFSCEDKEVTVTLEGSSWSRDVEGVITLRGKGLGMTTSSLGGRKEELGGGGLRGLLRKRPSNSSLGMTRSVSSLFLSGGVNGKNAEDGGRPRTERVEVESVRMCAKTPQELERWSKELSRVYSRIVGGSSYKEKRASEKRARAQNQRNELTVDEQPKSSGSLKKSFSSLFLPSLSRSLSTMTLATEELSPKASPPHSPLRTLDETIEEDENDNDTTVTLDDASTTGVSSPTFSVTTFSSSATSHTSFSRSNPRTTPPPPTHRSVFDATCESDYERLHLDTSCDRPTTSGSVRSIQSFRSLRAHSLAPQTLSKAQSHTLLRPSSATGSNSALQFSSPSYKRSQLGRSFYEG